MSRLLYPGDTSDLEDLAVILQRVHDDARKGVLAEIDRRKQNGVPLDDDARWHEVKERAQVLLLACDRRDSERTRKAAEGILEATATAIVDPGTYTPPEATKGVRVRMRILSARRYRELSRAEHRALADVKKLHDKEDVTTDERQQAFDRVVDAQFAFIGESLAALVVDGRTIEASGKTPIAAADIEAIERSGFLVPLYQACVAFQDLPWGKGEPSGSHAPSTSRSSTAALASSPDEKPRAATVEP